jgi:hypothetical protein
VEGPFAVIAKIKPEQGLAINFEDCLFSVFDNLRDLAFPGYETCHDFVRPLIAKSGDPRIAALGQAPNLCDSP